MYTAQCSVGDASMMDMPRYMLDYVAASSVMLLVGVILHSMQFLNGN